MEQPAELCARRDYLQLEGAAGRAHSAALHVLREGRHGQLLCDLRLADERAGTPAANEVAVADKLVEGGSDGEARDTEIGGELPLGGDRFADSERLDQLEDAVTGLALLGHRVAGVSSRGSGSSAGTSLGASRLSPVSTSKKWKRAGSTAKVSGRPTTAFTRGSIRAANKACSSASSVASSSSACPASRPIRGASTGKKTWASDPSSSTTAGSTSSVGEPGGADAAASNASGRIPSVILWCSGAGRRVGSSRIRSRPKTASSPSMAASTRFIAGVPMNAATNTLRGSW